MEASLDKENMKRQDGTALKRNFGLNAADYDGVMYYSSEFSISSEEVLLIKAKVKRRPRKFQVRSKNGSKQG